MVSRRSRPLLELQVLETFVSIVEAGKFSTAAKIVQLSPSAVSMQIKKLELAVGGPIFRRDARDVSLTPKGEVLFSYSRRILELNSRAFARCISPDLTGHVRIGAPDDVATHILPKALNLLLTILPNVAVDIICNKDTRWRKDASTLALDIEINNHRTDAKTNSGTVLFCEKLVWAGAKSGIAHLRDPLPISVTEGACIWSERAIDRLNDAGRAFRVAFLKHHPMSAWGALSADLAIAPLPRFSVGSELKILGKGDGLPMLGDYYVSLQVRPEPPPAVSAVRDHLESSLLGMRLTVC